MTKIGAPIRVWELPAPITVPAPKEDPMPVPALPEKEPVKR